MYKLKHALKKSKYIFAVIFLLWILLSIFLVAPLAVDVVEAKVDGKVDFNLFSDNLLPNFGNVKDNLKKCFQKDYFKTFEKGEIYLTIALMFLASVGIIKSFPKHEYTDIEHGSSDWASGGEQYEVLSSKKGIILAEKNYLPVDKRGNVNVLVVGRFWFW